VVRSGTAVYAGDDTLVTAKCSPAPEFMTSGEHVYRLPLGEVPEGGPYRVVVDGCGRSHDFRIAADAYRAATKMAMKGLYHQRCGIEISAAHSDTPRAECAEGHTFVLDQRFPVEPLASRPGLIKPLDPTKPKIEVRGGWHDAGDFDRRPHHLPNMLRLLSYYEMMPDRFADGEYDIPESGNGIPDWLDEAMWGVRLWEALQIDDPADPDYGGVRAGTESDAHPSYGAVSAATDTLQYATRAAQEYVTAWGAGLFAHASVLIRPYDTAHADALLQRARLAWAWLGTRGLTSADVPRIIYAALRLYWATGDQAFHDVFKRALGNLGGYPETYLSQNGSVTGAYHQIQIYSMPNPPHPVDAEIVEHYKFGNYRIYDRATKRGGYHCTDPRGEPYPSCLRCFLGWGSGAKMTALAELWMLALLMPDVGTPEERAGWYEIVATLADNALGRNAIGRVFHTGTERYRKTLGFEDAGLGVRQNLHLDGYFPFEGLSDGTPEMDARGTQPIGMPLGLLAGLFVDVPGGPKSAHFVRAIFQRVHPAWHLLPRERRWSEGWSLINSQETLLAATIIQPALFAFLQEPAGEVPPQPHADPPPVARRACSDCPARPRSATCDECPTCPEPSVSGAGGELLTVR
jgi:endoglucanase